MKVKLRLGEMANTQIKTPRIRNANSLPENTVSEGNQKTMSKAKDCPQWDHCSANLCPLDNLSLEWIPCDEICTAHAFSSLPWIKQQRKIARKVRNKDYFFTYEMLCQNCITTVATEGIDPDNDIADTDTLVNKWLKMHPEKKAKSLDQIERSRNNLANYRKGLIPLKKDQSAEENIKKDANPLRVSEPNP